MRRMPSLVLLACAIGGCHGQGSAAVLGGGPAPPPAASSPSPAQESLSFALTESGLDGQTVSGANFFDLSTLWVRVLASSVPLPTMLHLKFINPRGVNQLSAEAMFGADPNGASTMHPTMNTPMHLYPAKMLVAGVALDLAVPVGGTTLIKYVEEGDWSIEAVIDGLPGTARAPLHVVFLRGS